MNCDVRRPTLELPPNRHVSLQHYHLWARHARRYASAASSKRPTFASALAQFWGRKILPGHQSPLSEKTSYKLVSINWRDTFGIKTQALPCALSSSKKCNWPSSSFHNKFWFWNFADSIPKDQLVPSKQKPVPSQSSKQRSTASVAASKTWITATRGSRTAGCPCWD